MLMWPTWKTTLPQRPPSIKPRSLPVTMSSSQSHGRIVKPRQRPVSCTFCRTRKLRCSRSFPCASCTSRGLRCQQGLSQRQDDAEDPEPQNATVLERLKRLEEAVFKNVGSKVNQTQDLDRGQLEIQDVEKPTQDPDFDRLQMVGIRGRHVGSVLSDEILCEICPLRELGQRKNFVLQPDKDDKFNVRPYNCIWLPQKDETYKIAELYYNSTTYMYHVIHIPTMNKLIERTFQDLSGRNHDVRHITLILSILASTAYLWTPEDHHHRLFTTVEAARKLAINWTKSTLDMIEHACRTLDPSMELVQAMIIISFLVGSLEGVSTKCRSLYATAITFARELSFHCIDIDKPSKQMEQEKGAQTINTEVARRIWWYLAATDWMIPGFAGSRDSIYTVHPGHMKVNKPMNIDDNSLRDNHAVTELPCSHPSTMSYFLERVRLAEISREVVDRVRSPFLNIQDINYRQVMELDGKFKQLLHDLPPFFQLTQPQQVSRKGDITTMPGIIIQRYCINFLTNAHRCKLHLPFLRQATPGSLVCPSREACLEAARRIIQAKRLQERTQSMVIFASHMRLVGAFQCVCLAIVVLAMDLCFHRTSSDHYHACIDELKDACQILDAAKSQTMVAGKFFDCLTDVLERHGIFLPVGNSNFQQVDMAQPVFNGGSLPPESQDDNGISEGLECPGFDDSTFDGIWQTFAGQVDFGMVDLSSAFAELDSQYEYTQ